MSLHFGCHYKTIAFDQIQEVFSIQWALQPKLIILYKHNLWTGQDWVLDWMDDDRFRCELSVLYEVL